MGKIIGFSKITSKSQITIPKEVREILNVKKGENIILILEEDKVIIETAKK